MEGRVTRVPTCLSAVVRDFVRHLNTGDSPVSRAETIRGSCLALGAPVQGFELKVPGCARIAKRTHSRGTGGGEREKGCWGETGKRWVSRNLPNEPTSGGIADFRFSDLRLAGGYSVFTKRTHAPGAPGPGCESPSTKSAKLADHQTSFPYVPSVCRPDRAL